MPFLQDLKKDFEDVKVEWRESPLSKKIAFVILLTAMLALILFVLFLILSLFFTSILGSVILITIVSVVWAAWRLTKD